jgi:hypothetical protein
VNRDAELELIEKMIYDVDNPCRAVTICAPLGMGKRTLLTRLKNIHKGKVCVAAIDINRDIEINLIIDEIADQLSRQGLKAESYYNALSGSRVELSQNKFKDSPLYILDAITSSLESTNYLLSSLLKDIETPIAPPRMLLLFNRYEEAQKPLRKWFEDSLIPRITRRNGAVCVIAGERVPDFGIACGSEVSNVVLGGLTEEYITQWLVQEGLGYMPEEATFLWRAYRGHPASIRHYIDDL